MATTTTTTTTIEKIIVGGENQQQVAGVETKLILFAEMNEINATFLKLLYCSLTTNIIIIYRFL